MTEKTILREKYLESLQGFDISFHSITWHEKAQSESVPGGGNINYHVIPANGTMPHSHEFPEVILILRGRIIHQVNGERRELEAGSLLFIRPSDTHAFLPYRNEVCEMLILSYQLEMMLSLSEFFENDSFMRNTPTGVGKTHRSRGKDHRSGKHPHGRGEDKKQ